MKIKPLVDERMKQTIVERWKRFDGLGPKNRSFLVKLKLISLNKNKIFFFKTHQAKNKTILLTVGFYGWQSNEKPSHEQQSNLGSLRWVPHVNIEKRKTKLSGKATEGNKQN